MIYFTADWHMHDDEISRYERDLSITVVEQLILEEIECMQPEDEVYVLGDIGHLTNCIRAMKESPAKFYLVKGNHDIWDDETIYDMGFDKIYDKPIVVEDFFICSHEPMYMNRNMPYVNIFGHVHSNPIYNTYSACGACVCVERHGYSFVSLDEIKCKIKEKRWF